MEQAYETKGVINITIIRELFLSCKKLPLGYVRSLIQRFIKIVYLFVDDEPNVLHLSEPITIVGDIHGQYRDLLKILSLCPSLDDKHHPQNNGTILFLGDYVDRGVQSLETLLLLMCLKINHPKQVYMLRGNHQSLETTSHYGFLIEVIQKYNQDLFIDLLECFNALPLACVVNNNYFCVHGGLSPEYQTISDIQKNDRFDEIPRDGGICDLLWADPSTEQHGKLDVQSNNSNEPALFVKNDDRGCSVVFGYELTRKFLKKNDLITVIRAHQVEFQGYKQFIWPQWKEIPMIYTIFSAPNYCGTYKNKGAILTITQGKFNIRQFKEHDPKFSIPLRYNAFNFSIPKLLENLNLVYRKMAKVWAKEKMPELSNRSSTEIIDLYMLYYYHKNARISKNARSERQLQESFLRAEKQKEILKQKQESDQDQEQTLQLPVQHEKENQEESFKHSQSYFKESEKRPVSLMKLDLVKSVDLEDVLKK